MCPDNFVGLEKFPKKGSLLTYTPFTRGVRTNSWTDQFFTNAISFYTNRANSVADCSTVCCSKLACFRPASRGNVRQIWASFCPDLCKRALREFPHSKYFFCYALRSKKEVTRRKSNVHPCTNFEPNGPWCVDYKQTSSLSLSNHKDVAFSFVYFLKRPCESRVTICALLTSLYDS